MKNVLFHIFVYVLILTSICCKADLTNKREKTSTIVSNSISNDTIKDSIGISCIAKSDSLEIKAFTIELIEDMKNQNYNSIINKMKNPEKERKIIDEMSKDFPNYLNAVFTIEIDNDEDGSISSLATIKNSKMVYTENDNGCYSVSIGLETGLIIDLVRIDGELKIIKYEVAG